jgi:hypothetical protein
MCCAPGFSLSLKLSFCFAQVVDASQAKAEKWLDQPYQLSDSVRDVRDHGTPAAAGVAASVAPWTRIHLL